MLPARLDRSALVQGLKARLFLLTRHRLSTSRWYGYYRSREIQRALALPFDAEQLPPQYGRWVDERIVEYPWLFSRLPDGPGRLLDAGSVLNHDFVVGHPKLRRKSVTIMTLAPESECFWRQGISYIFGDLRHTCFQDNCFDQVVSLSTLEHVGLDNTLFYTSDASKKESDPAAFLDAVSELRRVVKPGGVVLISVPFGRHVRRDWLQVFDGAMIDSMIDVFRPASHAATYFKYSASGGWQLSSRAGAGDAIFFDPHVDTPWEGCPQTAEAVACLEMVKG